MVFLLRLYAAHWLGSPLVGTKEARQSLLLAPAVLHRSQRPH